MSCTNLAVGTLSAEQVREVLLLADKAPEVHHHRPWRFQCTATSIDLLLAGRTDPPGPNDNDRAAWVACGAALLNLRLAIRSCGIDPVVRLLPQLNRPWLLATVEIDGRRPTTSDGAELSLAMGLLETRTEHFRTDVIPEALIVELRYAARIEQAWIALLAPDDFPVLGTFVADSGDVELLDRSAHVAVTGTFQDDPASRIRAGQAMQRVLLTAARSDLSARFLAMTEASPAGREELRELIGGGLWPQAVLQIGRSDV